MSDDLNTVYIHLHRRAGGEIAVAFDPPGDLDGLRLLLATVPGDLVVLRDGEWTLDSLDAARAVALACELRADYEVVVFDGLQTTVFWPPPEPLRHLFGGGPRAQGGGSWADEFFERLPEELRDRAFRALTRLLHPDRGGDEAMMRDLLDARERAAGR